MQYNQSKYCNLKCKTNNTANYITGKKYYDFKYNWSKNEKHQSES